MWEERSEESMSKRVECPYCRKQRRLFNVVGDEGRVSIEIKCRQCGHVLNVQINGDKILVKGIEK